MFKINKYFGGNVVSISFETESLPTTVGVMAVGEYEFNTDKKETITVISGAFTVKLPDNDDWQIFNNGEQFIIEARQKFQLKSEVETAYICTYSEESTEENNAHISRHQQEKQQLISRRTHERYQVVSRRQHERYDVGQYPVELKKPDGTILKATLNDISYQGFQIVCTGMTSRMISQKTGVLTSGDSEKVEITINIKTKNKKVEKIIADCKVIYIAKSEDAVGENSFVVGLEAKDFKGNSIATIKKLM